MKRNKIPPVLFLNGDETLLKGTLSFKLYWQKAIHLLLRQRGRTVLLFSEIQIIPLALLTAYTIENKAMKNSAPLT